MEQFNSSDLKSIIHSKRSNLFYLEHCRILVNGGRVEYVTEEGELSKYWNIPIANTTALLLGSGTSITQGAMRELAKAGVLVGFCGGGGTPIYSATEPEDPVVWFQPQSEYRPTEYMQKWIQLWSNEKLRLEAAKSFMDIRIANIHVHWQRRIQEGRSFSLSLDRLEASLEKSRARFPFAESTNDLLLEEALLTKDLYRLASTATSYGEFTRSKRGLAVDPANELLDYGNYLAYGLAAVASWVLGIPHGLSVLHGKTRRGGLVFDLADLVKDALILPEAFLSGKAGMNDVDFRKLILRRFREHDALDQMIDCIKNLTLRFGNIH